MTARVGDMVLWTPIEAPHEEWAALVVAASDDGPTLQVFLPGGSQQVVFTARENPSPVAETATWRHRE